MADTQRSAYERVQLARSEDRPNIQDYIDHLFTDFFEQRGDRCQHGRWFHCGRHCACWGTVR